MKNILDRILTVVIFLVSFALLAGIIGIMSQGHRVDMPAWLTALLGILSALASIAACMWGAKDE